MIQENKYKDVSGLAPELLQGIVQTLVKRRPVDKIVLYGSRANGNFRETSDIDIALFSHDWTDRDVNLAKDDLEEFLRTALNIDLVNFYSVEKQALKNSILNQGRILYESKPDK